MAQDHSIRIGIDSSGSVAGARQYGRAIAEIRGDTRQMVQLLGQMADGSGRADVAQVRLARSSLGLASALATAGISVYAVVNQFRQATREAEGYSRALADIVNQTDVTREQLTAWAPELDAIAVSLGRMPGEVLGGLKAVASAGFAGAEAMQITESAAKAAAVGLGEVDAIARTVSAAVRAYGPEVLSAAQATDILLATVRAGAAEANEIAPVLGRVVGIAQQVGISFAEVGGFIATFTRLGVDADEAVTALRGTMTTLLGPTKQQQEALALAGMTMASLREEIREKGLAAALVDLVARFRGNEDALSAIIPNVRALAAVLGTAGAQAEQFVQVERDVENATGGIDRAISALADNPAFKFEQARAGAALFRRQLGEELLPAIIDVGQGLQEAFGTNAQDAAHNLGRAIGFVIRQLDDAFTKATLLGRLLVQVNRWRAESTSDLGDTLMGRSEIDNLRGSLQKVWSKQAVGIQAADLEAAQARAASLRQEIDALNKTLERGGSLKIIKEAREDRDVREALLTDLDRLMVQAGKLPLLFAETITVTDTQTRSFSALSDKQKQLAEQYGQTAAMLALRLAQEREIGALIRSTPYAEQEAALARLAIQHEHQVTVLENEARFAEFGAGRAHLLAVAIADQARAVALARLDNEEYSEGLRQLADALKEVDAAIKAIPELGRETLLGPRLEIDVESQQRVLDIVRGLQSPAEAYRREVAEVNALMARFPAYAEELQQHLARMKDEWLGYRTIAAGALRATADLARDVFSEIISGGEVSWRAVADSLIRIWADAMADLLRQWIANLIRMKAAEQAAGLGSSATAGGSGGGTGGMFGSLFGKAAMGNPMTGGQWSMSAGAYAGIFAAVAAVIINQIKTSGRAHSSIAFDIGGSAGMGYSSAGSGWNTNVSAASLRSNMAAATAVMTAVNDFLREIGAEFDRTAEITGRISIGRTGQGKKTDWYVTYGAGLVRNFGRDLEAAMEFGAVQAIKMAPLKGLDPIVLRAISRSMAETMDKLRDDIALATEVANIGLSGVELEIVKIRPHFDDLRKRITALLGPSIELAEALRRLSLAETNAWQSARDAITGRERTAEEDYQDRLRQAKLFNSELALRKQDIQLQIAQIDATIVRVKSGAIFNRALLEETEIFIETGRGFIRTMGGVGMAIGMASGMSQEAIDAWIKRLEDQRGTLQDILDSLPGAIDPSEILRRGRAGAGGADRTDEREALRNEAARFGLHEVRAALLDASQRHLDYAERVREAGFSAAEAADLIKKSEQELARERQRIARDQRQASGEFVLRGTPFGGDLIASLQDVTRESMSLQESNRALEAAGEMTLREMRELNRAIRESAERQRQDLGRQAELGLLSTLYGYLGMTEGAARLEWDLKLAGLKIAYEELKIANQIYNLNLQNLDAIGALIGRFEAAGPPVTAPAPPAIRESQPDTRTEDIQRIREDIRDTFDDILKGLLAFRDNLVLDEQLSSFTPAQKVAEALRQYEDIQARAARGDVEALRGRESVARTYLREFQAAYGSTAPYQEAFQRVLADTGGLIANIDQLRETATVAAIREAGLNILEFSRQNHGNLARIIDNTDPDRPRRVLVEPLPQPLPPSGPRPFLPDAGNQPGPRSAFQAASSGGGEVVEAVDRAGLSTALQLAALKKAVDALAAALSADQADRQRLQHTLERVLSGETATVQRTGTGG